MPCPEALEIGSPNSNKVVVSDVGIDASSHDNVIEATDALIKLFQEINAQDLHQYATSPFSLRFTAPATAYVAPQYARRTCMIEAPILVGTPGATDTLAKFLNLLREEFDGRPHWGQINNSDYSKLKELYPETYDRFIKNYDRFNAKKAFTNVFTEITLNPSTQH